MGNLVEPLKRKALGKGLESLLPRINAVTEERVEKVSSDGTPREIPLDAIDRNPFQTRTQFDEVALGELAASIAATGVVQPILVRQMPGDRFQLIVGERRFLASKKAGKSTIPAILRQVSDEQAMEITIVENLQRTDLNPMEQARAYDRLSREFKLTQEQMAQRTGKDRASVANFLRLLKLPDPVKKLLASGQLSMGHARALLAIDSPKKQEQLADRVVRKNLNVRQTEMLASESSPKTVEKKEKEKDVFTRDAEDKLQRTLRTRVEIDRRRRGGVIHIRYGSEEELIRVVDELMGRRR